VASYFYESDLLFDNKKDISGIRENDVVSASYQPESNIEDVEDKHGSSFFSYSGFTLLYRFFDSMKFQALEKKYTRMLKFDISKCFGSIYSHSISWAVKDKSYSKANIGLNSFDAMFDKIIQNMNDGETNGIVIGPEFSRVFAEIILQRVDGNVEENLKSFGLINKAHYEVYRYVDDYFLFTRNEEVESSVYLEFQKELEKFKLFVNESKEVRISRPFATDLTIAKIEVKDLINDFFKSVRYCSESTDVAESKAPSIEYIYKPYTRANNLINRFKSIVKKSNSSYEGFSGLVFSMFRSRISKLLKEVKDVDCMDKNSCRYKNFIVLCVDFLGFLYSMSPKVRASFLLSQILVIIHDIKPYLVLSDQLDLVKKLKDESRFIINNVVQSDAPRIESLNVIVSLRNLFPGEVIEDSQVLNYFRISEDLKVDHLDYFEIVSLLHMLCLDGDNPELIKSVYSDFLVRLNSSDKPFESSELILLFLDLGAFPYKRENLYKGAVDCLYRAKTKRSLASNELNEIVNFVSKKRFFVDWRRNFNIRKVLQKKEMQAGYE